MKKILSLLLAFALAGCVAHKQDLRLETLGTKYKLGSGDVVDFTAITKNNQGAGSALDGDLLDGISSATFSQLGSSIESAEITDLTIVDADISASAAIAATKISFSDPDNTFIATNVDAALAEPNNTLAGGPNNGGMLHWSQLVSMPAGIADGADAAGGTPASTSTDVSSSASSAGVDSDYAREDHTHRGVASFRKAGDTLFFGAATLTGGSNVTLTQSGQDISIASTAGDPQEAYISTLASDIEISNDNTQTNFTLRNKIVDTIRDSSGINAGSSSNYTVRGTPNFDVILNSTPVLLNSHTSATVAGFGIMGDYSDVEYETATQFTTDGVSDYSSITKCEFQLAAAVGSPTGNITAQIWSNTGGDLPNAIVHANATGSVSPTASAWNTVNFAGTFSLSNNTKYWLRLSAPAQSTNSRWEWIDSTPTSGANGMSRSTNGGSTWSAINTGRAGNMKIYKSGASSATVVWNSFTTSAAPSKFLIYANTTPGTGSITWDISRNGGTNYQTGVSLNTLTTFTSTSGSSVVLKGTITGDAQIDDVAVQAVP